MAPYSEHTFKVLGYGTRSRGISQFYLHIPHTSANGMNHTCFCLPSHSWYSFTDPGGMVRLSWPCWILAISDVAKVILLVVVLCEMSVKH